MHVILVTGMSGAGKSTALRTLEDAGFEAVDNVPLSLLPLLCGEPQAEHVPQRLAIGVDVRSRDFSGEALANVWHALKEKAHLKLEMLLLTAEPAIIGQRFSETRRRHPLALDRPIEDGIVVERAIIAPLFALATMVIDTSGLPAAELKNLLTERYSGDVPPLTLTVVSFSFARGLPRGADMVLDVRFLRNPHYDPILKPLTGKDEAVGAFIALDPDFAPFLHNTQTLITPLLPRMVTEGKHYLTLAVGCTGGRHRSVYTAILLHQWLQSLGYHATLRHRELAAG
jgi:UPF0042 nucleotide-binding protein